MPNGIGKHEEVEDDEISVATPPMVALTENEKLPKPAEAEDFEELLPADDDDDEGDEEEPIDIEEHDTEPLQELAARTRKKRGKKKGKKKRTVKQEVIDKQEAARAKDYDEWCQYLDHEIGWQRPGVVCKVIRDYPTMLGHTITAGTVDLRNAGYFTEEEIRHKHGGGNYRILFLAI